MTADTVVHPSAPMPKGYTFVPKGNVYITAHCRTATHAANKPLYVVSSKAGTPAATVSGSVLGLRCPIHIAEAVRADERASRSTRQAATAKRDDALAATFRTAVLAAYPRVPGDAVLEQIVAHAMVKKQGRVARTGTLGQAERVRLAVRAHIRHRHTNYDALLRGESKEKRDKGKQKNGKNNKKRRPHGISREKARAMTLGQVDAIEREWAGGKTFGKKTPKDKEDIQAAAVSRKRKSDDVDGISTEEPSQEPLLESSQEPPQHPPKRPTRQCKTRAVSRITQCLQGAGRATADAIVIDSSDEYDVMVIDSGTD